MDWRFVVNGVREYGWDTIRPVWVGSVLEVWSRQFGARYSNMPIWLHRALFEHAEQAFDEWKTGMHRSLEQMTQLISCQEKSDLERLVKRFDFIFRPSSLVAFVMESKRLGWNYVCKSYHAKGRKFVAHWFMKDQEWLCISYEGVELVTWKNHFDAVSPGCHHHLCSHLVNPRMTWEDYEDRYVSKVGTAAGKALI